jgi:SAM-dependent methyltransferase
MTNGAETQKRRTRIALARRCATHVGDQKLGGMITESMTRMGARVRGIDVVERNIDIAREHARNSALDVRYDATTVEALATSGARFDVVLNMEVVEHVPDVAAFMADCAALVRPGGVTALATLNRTPDGQLVSGARAFAELWAALPGFRLLGRAARTRTALPLLEAGYRGFLRLRPAMQRLAARMTGPPSS